MTTTKPWADQPFSLLLIPGQLGAPTCTNPHILSVAIEMAAVHNALLRGLNAIYLQSPFIHTPSSISDFTLYIHYWVTGVHHHHSGEERLFFPHIREILREAGEPDDLMDANTAQHAAFEAKMQELGVYVQEVRDGKARYESAVLRGLVDGFAPVLTQHLHEEIETLLRLEKCDGEQVVKAMAVTADEVIKTADRYTVVPLLLGCIDKTYPGSESFPPVPWFLPWLSAYWFSRRHRGMWRFNPSGCWGRPRELQFLQ